jgi:molybdopterin-guanine dinucleotide biosynthesis protein A
MLQAKSLGTDITAIVLAGGQGARMGGLDKGLQPFRGKALARHAVDRLLHSGGIHRVLISANRNTAEYATWGWPVIGDHLEGFQGPLAGFLAGWSACDTDYLITVPCDTPLFPTDLVQHMQACLREQNAKIALACAPESPTRPELRRQPAFCLMHKSVRPDLTQFVADGGRKIGAWAQRHPMVLVPFNRPQDSPWAFSNVNTLEDLHTLESMANEHAP